MLFMPGAACVGSVIKLVCVRDEIGSVGGKFVVVKRKEMFVREKLLPTISFIRGLPHGVVSKPDKNSLLPR